jgi:membrane fusion protein, heavy metal efflux system
MSEITISDKSSHEKEELENSKVENSKPVRTKSGKMTMVILKFLGSLSTVLVLILLTGIAYWGHHSDWKISRFSILTGVEQDAEADWCETHNVPESECIECDKDLVPFGEDYGWCEKHGVFQCSLEHPELFELKKRPIISLKEMNRIKSSLILLPRKINNSGSLLYRQRVQFASVESVRKAGIDVEIVERKLMTENITANGEIRYDETKVAKSSSRVAGSIWKVNKKIGDKVTKGEMLAIIDSAEIGKYKAEFLNALTQHDYSQKNFNRLEPLSNKGVVTKQRILEAQTELQKAKTAILRTHQTLLNLGFQISYEKMLNLSEIERVNKMLYLGFPDNLQQKLKKANIRTNNLYPVLAFLDGTLIERSAVSGEVINTQNVLFKIADTERMWLVLNVSLENANHVSLGQKILFTLDGSNQLITGKINWISTTADKTTRTVTVRAELNNKNSKLRNESFGVGQIVLREEPEAIVVPNESVQLAEDGDYVFIRDKNFFNKESPKFFHTRSVRIGVRTDEFTEIIAGVYPGEIVATKGSTVLRAQILKNNLGAGCTCGK